MDRFKNLLFSYADLGCFCNFGVSECFKRFSIALKRSLKHLL